MGGNGTVCVECCLKERLLDQEAGHFTAGAVARIVPAHGHVTAMSLNQELSNIAIVGDPDRSRGMEVRT